jgi:hypothetical protein
MDLIIRKGHHAYQYNAAKRVHQTAIPILSKTSIAARSEVTTIQDINITAHTHMTLEQYS